MMIIASVEAASECHENLEKMFFNENYSIHKFAHQFVSGSLWILSITRASNSKTTECKTIIIQSADEQTITTGHDFAIESKDTYPLTMLMKQQGKLNQDIFNRAVAQFRVH